MVKASVDALSLDLGGASNSVSTSFGDHASGEISADTSTR